LKAALDGHALGLPLFWVPLELARQSSHGGWLAAALTMLAKALAFSPPWLATLLLRLLKRQAARLEAQMTGVLSPQNVPPSSTSLAPQSQRVLTPVP
jgi:hypothetical protein